jgi:hypothetical protein
MTHSRSVPDFLAPGARSNWAFANFASGSYQSFRAGAALRVRTASTTPAKSMRIRPPGLVALQDLFVTPGCRSRTPALSFSSMNSTPACVDVR